MKIEKEFLQKLEGNFTPEQNLLIRKAFIETINNRFKHVLVTQVTREELYVSRVKNHMKELLLKEVSSSIKFSKEKLENGNLQLRAELLMVSI